MFKEVIKNLIKQPGVKLNISLTLIFAGLFWANQSWAASLYLSPSFGSSSVGKTFSVSVYVSSKDAPINAVSGVVSFPSDKLELISLSKSSSIFNLWVTEPSFSQSAGTLTFEGVILNPGYTGTSGKIISANFKVRTGGTAKLSFSSGAILANDGEGTNVLSGFGSASFNLVDNQESKPTEPKEEVAPKPVSEPTPSPAPAMTDTLLPKLSSKTHPDQDKWFANKDIKLSWSVPSGVTSLRLSLSSSPNDVPTVSYTPPISSKEFVEVSDGVYYFAARFKNASDWGPIARYVLRIDTTPPEPIIITWLDGQTTTNPQPKLKLVTTDGVSGLDYYSLKINDEPAITIKPEELLDGVYTLPVQNIGSKQVTVEAYDLAGNKSFASDKIEIIAGTTYSKNLTLTSWPEKVKVGDLLTIKGKTAGLNKIIIFWQKDGGPIASKQTINDLSGNFSFSLKLQEIGNYQFWAEIKDDQGLVIASSDKVKIKVVEGIVKVTWGIIQNFWWVFLLLVLPGLVYACWRLPWVSGCYQGLPKKNKLPRHSLLPLLFLLRDDIKDQVKILMAAKTKRRLSKEEVLVMDNLKKTINNANRFLTKTSTKKK